MPPMERFTVDVGGRPMHVMQRGHGLPVVMLHGNPTWGFLYRRVLEVLRQRDAFVSLRAVVPDLIGLGFSDHPRDGHLHTIENHSRWVARMIDALDLERVVLVVQDWGGPIGLHAFADQLDRLAGLVVMNTVLGPPRSGFRPTAFHRFAHTPVASTLAFRLGQMPQAALHLAQGDRASIRGRVARAYRYPLRNPLTNAAPLALGRMVPDSLAHPSVPALQKVEAAARAFAGPKAMVWGDRDPVLGRTKKHVRSILGDPDCVSTDAGHFIQEEQPEAIADAILHVAGAV